MILQGKQIYLKENLLEKNYPSILESFHDLEIVGYLSFAKKALLLKNTTELRNFMAAFGDEIIFEIYNNDNKFIGYTSLSDFKEKTECEFGIFILNKKYWGKGIGSEVTHAMLNYAFKKLGINKVTLTTSEFNKNAISLYEKIGFKITKLLPKDRTIFYDNKWLLSGTVLMEINEEDFIVAL